MLRFRCTTSTYISTISDSDLIGTCKARVPILCHVLQGRFGNPDNLDVQGEGVGVVLPDGGEGGVGDGVVREVVDQDLGVYSVLLRDLESLV